MDQITAGGLFELAADQLDMATSAPVGPLQHNVIGGVGVLLDEFLFRSQRLQDLASLGDLASAPPPITGSPLGTAPITGSPLGTTPITGSPLGTTPITGSPLGTTPI